MIKKKKGLASSIGSKIRNVNLLNQRGSIKFQLSIGLLIPIVFLAVFGVVSYKRSESAIIGNYENSSSDTIDAINNYMNLGLSTAERSSMELVLDTNFKEFFDLDYDKAKSSKRSYDDLNDRIGLLASSNYFIEDIHVISANGVTLSTNSSVKENLFEAVQDTEIGAAFKENPTLQFTWMGSHSEIDQVMLDGERPYNTDGYSMSANKKVFRQQRFCNC